MARALAASSVVVLVIAAGPAVASTGTHAHRFIFPARSAHAHGRWHRPRAHAAVVGGTPIKIEQAPWQVAILREGAFACGGSIIDESHVVTAAICVTEKSGKALPATSLQVLAGSSNVVTENEEDDTVELRKVKTGGVRVHPFYKPGSPLAPDDVAVVQLETPLKIEPAKVQAIALPSSPASPGEGTPAGFTGYGEENPLTNELNGGLYSAAMALSYPYPCGEQADAVALCASGGLGGATACGGDGGSPLVSEGETPTLLGLLVAIRAGCGLGSTNAFANVAAPEVRDFIEGKPVPLAPRAPKPKSPESAFISGFLEPGHLLTCYPGVWTGSPKYTFAFMESPGERVLQSGESPAYAVTEADAGREISCEIQASNEGGTGILRTKPLEPIKGHPTGGGGSTSTPSTTGGGGAAGGVLATTETRPSPAQIEAALRAVLTPTGKAAKASRLRRTHRFTVSFSAPAAGTVAIDWFQVPRGARLARAHPILIASGHATFSAAARAKVTLELTAAGRRLLAHAHSVRLTAKATFTLAGGSRFAVRSAFTLRS
jgi:hypothetical protein